MPRRIDPSRNIGLEPSNNSTHDTNTMSFTKLQHNVEVTYQLLALFPHRIKTIQDARMEVQHNCQAAKKIADAKLATDFQTILKEFQKAQRLAVEREAAYAPFFFSSRSAIEKGIFLLLLASSIASVQGSLMFSVRGFRVNGNDSLKICVNTRKRCKTL
ncbi:uncharacterized protein LOC120700278 isoform X2 [Panicum virgatum]|uniref:uncharacterized protein LOC120700278 isoform X2 n=1 Tax=Panicum virgatum TaxID=38727 RepID=UPI0019D5DA74|nr:uncharacterized protein LOC120700278 isoform X2 [Panicum virgatum]